LKFILSIIFLFITQDQPLLQKIKADADYLVYMDTQIQIRDGFRSKRFVFPQNAPLGVPVHTISTDEIDIDKFYHTVNDEFETMLYPISGQQ
jgi:hypothetical protein